MFEVRGDPGFFNITTMTEWDSAANGNCGGNKLVIDIQPAFQLTQMQTDINSLRFDLERMRQESDKEFMLRNSNPSLKDAYEKYQTIYKLVKQTVDAIEGNDGGG